jgi:subtilisin family serine protease
MPNKNYIVLRASGPQPKSPFAGPGVDHRGFERAGSGPVRTEFAVESLGKQDLADLKRDAKVQGVAPSMPVRLIKPMASAAADAPKGKGTAWGITATKANKSPYTGKGITVAILDTGIDAKHPAFQGVNLLQKDFTGEGNDDTVGHGTHCAGTVFGRNVNDYRFGVAQGVERALIGKVLGAKGGSTAQIVEGILWAMQEGAQIISMSLGMDFPGYVDWLIKSEGYPADLATSVALQGYRDNIRLFDKLAELTKAQAQFGKPTIVIAAAGNESRREVKPDYEIIVAPPAAADDFIAVGALGQAGSTKKLNVADFSNTGPDVSGPGVGIFSAWPEGGFRLLSGTSMATPHVAGIAALWAEKLEAAGRLNTTELVSRLISSGVTTPLAKDVDPFDVGSGLVQAPLS